MAWRYRRRKFEDGDFATPPDWNKNIAESIGEFNGMLDRDNFGTGAFAEARLVDQSFNLMDSDPHDSSEPCTISGDTLDWQDGDSSYDIGSLSAEVPVDGSILVEWSGWWKWDSAFGYGSADDFAVKFRIVIDGSPVCESGWSSMNRFYDTTYIVGAAFIQAGFHTIKVQAKSAYLDGGNPMTAIISTTDVIIYGRELTYDARLR